MQDIIDQLRSEGFVIDSFVPDGKIRRFALGADDKRKSGFYLGYQNFLPSDGQQFYVVTYGSWREGIENARTYSTLRSHCSPEDRKLVKEQLEKQRRTAEKLRSSEYEEVAKEVQEKWNTLSETGSSPYLERKQISGVGLGIRFRGENIYVPIRDEQGKLWSLQRITPDGSKRFHTGGRVMGGSHVIGKCDGGTVFIAEGLSTAASVHLATGRPVVCAFSAASLASAASQYQKHQDSGGLVIVAGDDDRGRHDNPGRRAAEAAAAKTFNDARFPQFQEGNEGSDWNDLHCREGIEVVRQQLSIQKEEGPGQYLTALGFKEKEYFFTSSENQQIVAISSFSKSDFLNLMPIDYWETLFPGSGQTRIAWDDASSNLMEKARAKGIFQSQNIRGAGVWEDGGRVVVNMGDHLIVDGRQCGLGEIKSRYFYTLGTKLPRLHPHPLTVEECQVVLKSCYLFRWKRIDFGFLLAGAMVTTRVCGALPVRPHVWLTGEKGSGKTTLFNRLIHPLIGEPLIFAGGNTTEAGLRQEVSANAVPVLFDEFENNGQKSAESIQSVLDLMRLSWSETQASIIKGSATGVASTYRARFAAIVTSIRQVSMSDADRSRFATLELDPHGSDEAHWAELDAMLLKITPEIGSRLFARTIQKLPILILNFKAMKAALNRRNPGQRFGDQYGMLLGGMALLTQDEPLNAAQADEIASQITLEEEREESAVSDHQNALESLLTWKMTYESDTGRREDLVGDLIQICLNSSTHCAAGKALNLIGIAVHTDGVDIASGNHAELAKVFRGTQWNKSWANALLRLTGSKRDIGRQTDRRQFRCIRVPFSHF